MSWLFTSVVATYLLVIAVFAVATARTSKPSLREPLEPLVRIGMKIGQGAIGIVVLFAGVALLKGHQPDAVWISTGYCVAALGVPVMLLTRQPDPNGEPVEPPHLYVIAVAAFTAMILVLRLQQTW